MSIPDASADLARVVRRVQAVLLKKISCDQLLTMSDISQLEEIGGATSRSPMLFRQKESSALSMLIQGGKIISFDSMPVLETTAIEVLGTGWQAKLLHASRHYKVYGTGNFSKDDLAILGGTLDLFYENSMIKVNIDRDRLSRLRDRIRTTMDKLNIEGPLVLPRLITSVTGHAAAVARVRSGELAILRLHADQDLPNELVAMLATSGIAEAVGETEGASAASDGEGALTVKISKEPRKQLSNPRMAVHDAIHFGKPQFFESPEVSKAKMLVFPITTAEIFTESKASRPRLLLFVKSRVSFSRSDVEAVEISLETYVHRRTMANRLQTLAESRAKLQELASIKVLPEDITHSSLQQLFSNYARWIAIKTLEATAAHSLTVRLYDHASRSLRIAAGESDTEGWYRETDGNGEINVKKMRRTSLNAFTFIHAGAQDFDYGYLPVINPRDPGIKDIPPELRKMGLIAALNVRPNTESEICFPLRYGRVPIGTVNIESPVPEAFEGALDFLKAIRDNIEEAYQRTLGYNDIRSLSRQIAMHAAVHELDQYVNLDPPMFNETQVRLLSSLFNLRATSDEPPSDLGKWLDAWVPATYPSFSRETVAEVRGLVRVLSLSTQRLLPAQWSGLLFIIKNLVQNILSHGDTRPEGGNSIVIDDRPLYGIGEHFIRITSKQTAIRDQAVLDRVCVAPIFSREGGARYGMLLIGMITKTLGGQAFMGRDPYTQFTECLIKIPYALSVEGREAEA